MKRLLFSLLAVTLVSGLALVVAACGEGRQSNYEWNWAADNQDIVAGTLHMQLTYTVIYTGQMHFTVRINDDDYNDWDYLWMVLDQNQNGKIDLGTIDSPYGLWANNMTAPAGLFQNRLAFAEVPPSQDRTNVSLISTQATPLTFPSSSQKGQTLFCYA